MAQLSNCKILQQVIDYIVIQSIMVPVPDNNLYQSISLPVVSFSMRNTIMIVFYIEGYRNVSSRWSKFVLDCERTSSCTLQIRVFLFVLNSFLIKYLMWIFSLICCFFVEQRPIQKWWCDPFTSLYNEQKLALSLTSITIDKSTRSQWICSGW